MFIKAPGDHNDKKNTNSRELFQETVKICPILKSKSVISKKLSMVGQVLGCPCSHGGL